MLYQEKDPGYTPGQLIRFHAVVLHHQGHRLARIMVENHDDFRILRDSVAMVLPAIETDENARPVRINRVQDHYVSAIRTLERDRDTIANRRVLMSTETTMVCRMLSGCIHSCGMILGIMRRASRVPEPLLPVPAEPALRRHRRHRWTDDSAGSTHPSRENPG